MSKAPVIANISDLLAIAYQIESDAVQRYALLAEQMETHNNPELVKIFRDLARAEGLHAEEIRKMAGGEDIAQRAEAMRGSWRGDSPEEVDLGEVHYLMTPWEALQLSLAGEKRALEFFTLVVQTTKDPKVKEMAEEFVEEEAEHVNLVYRLMRKYPKPSDSRSDDPDTPLAQG